jgi:hypothetical protein
MSRGHDGRTNAPAAGFFHGGNRRLWLASIALPVVAIIPVALYIMFEPEPQLDDVESAVREYGFDPLKPPSRLRGPGALYQLQDSSYKKVCDVTPELLAGKLQQSPTLDQVRKRLEKGKFSVSGSLLEALNGRLEGARITSIEYRLKNVIISEIALDALLEIRDTLLRQKHCDEIVNSLLKANKQVCPGYSTLSATATYTVHFDLKVDGSAKSKSPVTNVVRQVIQEETGAEINVHNESQFTGENLFYGIQLSPLCIVPNTATEPSPRPPQPAALERISQVGNVTE